MNSLSPLAERSFFYHIRNFFCPETSVLKCFLPGPASVAICFPLLCAVSEAFFGLTLGYQKSIFLPHEVDQPKREDAQDHTYDREGPGEKGAQ